MCFEYVTANGSATEGEDFEAAQGTFCMSAGETSGTVEVTAFGDVDVEPNETFFLRLSNMLPDVVLVTP